MLRARPARITWALDTGVPMHREPLVDRSFASVGELRDALRDLQSQTVKVEATASTADDLAHAWDAAVRAHQEGDLEQAMAGYADVLVPENRLCDRLRAEQVERFGDRTVHAASLAVPAGTMIE